VSFTLTTLKDAKEPYIFAKEPYILAKEHIYKHIYIYIIVSYTLTDADAYTFAKEPYIFAKEPYILAKEHIYKHIYIYILSCRIHSQMQTPIHSQKSPIYLQKSPIY